MLVRLSIAILCVGQISLPASGQSREGAHHQKIRLVRPTEALKKLGEPRLDSSRTLQGEVQETASESDLHQLGISIKRDLQTGIIVVDEVEHGSLAAQNHIYKRDVVTSFTKKGQSISLVIERDGKRYRAELGKSDNNLKPTLTETVATDGKLKGALGIAPSPATEPSATKLNSDDASNNKKLAVRENPAPIRTQHKQKILLRITYHMRDPANTFMAIKMARKLAANGRAEIVVFLDKEAVNALNMHSNMAEIEHGETQSKTIKTVLEAYLADGGRIIVSQSWAQRLGLHKGNIIEGTEFMDDDQVVQEIIDSDKVLEY